jgi:hypothetical protein
MTTPIVYVTTWCKNPQLLYGSTLVFDSIRVGFPNAEVVVIENASIREARAAIVEAAQAADCKIRLVEKELPHWKILEDLCLSAKRPFVFLDPDVAFWGSVEDWEFGGALMAGRFLPPCEVVNGRYLVPRLHTSHLWFPDPFRLQDRISSITANGAAVTKLFQGGGMPCGLQWDTADILHLALGADAQPFTEVQLEAYDHLFAGSYLPDVQGRINREMGDAMGEWHAMARMDYRSLKGSWRRQQEILESAPWSPEVAGRPWKTEVLDYALARQPGRLARLRRRLLG